jgi:hypothetical protein
LVTCLFKDFVRADYEPQTVQTLCLQGCQQLSLLQGVINQLEEKSWTAFMEAKVTQRKQETKVSTSEAKMIFLHVLLLIIKQYFPHKIVFFYLLKFYVWNIGSANIFQVL